jgi:hypothetical protein
MIMVKSFHCITRKSPETQIAHASLGLEQEVFNSSLCQFVIAQPRQLKTPLTRIGNSYTMDLSHKPVYCLHALNHVGKPPVEEVL